MLVGAFLSVTAQAGVIWLALGSSVFADFASTLRVTLTYADWLESKPFMSHSLRAVTRLLPNAIGAPLWLALTALVLWYTVRVWKSDAPVRVRLGVVMLASLLVNPHVIVYDVTLFALPLSGSAPTCSTQSAARTRRRSACLGLLAVRGAIHSDSRPVIGLQASVPLMMGTARVDDPRGDTKPDKTS